MIDNYNNYNYLNFLFDQRVSITKLGKSYKVKNMYQVGVSP